MNDNRHTDDQQILKADTNTQSTRENILGRKDKPSSKFDPVYQMLYWGLFKKTIMPPKGDGKGIELLQNDSIDFLMDNLEKHRQVLWVNIIAALFLYLWGMDIINSAGDPGVVVTGLLAPAMITGAAWYTVSFGGIPQTHVMFAIPLTRFMFSAFTLSMTLLIGILIDITGPLFGVLVLVPIYMGLYIASVMYDNMDGLKIGLDEALLKMSRATLNYHVKSGHVAAQETDKESNFSVEGAPHLSDFIYHFGRVEKQISNLLSKPNVGVANLTIARALHHFISLTKLNLKPNKQNEFDSNINSIFSKNSSLSNEQQIVLDELREKGVHGFSDFIKHSHTLEPNTVDIISISILDIIVNHLQQGLKSDSARSEINDIETTIKSFRDKKVEISLESYESKTENEKVQEQMVADYIFADIFDGIFSLIGSHKNDFISGNKH